MSKAIELASALANGDSSLGTAKSAAAELRRLAAVEKQLEAAQAELAAIRSLEPVARVVSMYGDPEEFGERDVAITKSLQKLPYGTSLVALPEQK